jgi:N-acetylneuraminic acid mutarotase
MWTRKADIPIAVSSPSVSATGGKIYVIGGRPPNGAMVQEYDPATDSWARKADMPTPRVCLSTSVIDGKIYAFGGGSTGSGPFLPTVEVYDPSTDAWTSKGDMPSARYGLSTSLVNGKIYAVGGNIIENGDEFSVSVVESYNPQTDTWTRKADVPVARFVLSTVVAGGKLFAVGGVMWPSQEFVAAFEAYDVDTDAWESKADMPVARALTRSAHLIDEEIYTIGGEQDYMPVMAYNPATDTWREVTRQRVPSMAVATARVGDTIYAFAGAPHPYEASVTAYAYELELTTNGR